MAFDPRLAVLCGDFIQVVYDMYEANPNILTPPPSSHFPTGYQLSGWVLMKELFAGGNESFFGFFAHHTNDPDDAVLAIRGTEPGEWLTDFISQLMKPFKVRGKGNVGIGWESLYETFRVVDSRTKKALNGTFSEQAEELLRGYAAHPSVQVTGHSLGAALATLYAAENAFTHQHTSIRSLYTFGSPMVGDDIFADAFDELGLESWRISNVRDWAPKLPLVLPLAPYHHIRKVRSYDSLGKVKPTLKCVHSLATYLSLIDSMRKPDEDCQWPAKDVSARSMVRVPTESLRGIWGLCSGQDAISIGTNGVESAVTYRVTSDAASTIDVMIYSVDPSNPTTIKPGDYADHLLEGGATLWVAPDPSQSGTAQGQYWVR
jgi:hypothetical protein